MNIQINMILLAITNICIIFGCYNLGRQVDRLKKNFDINIMYYYHRLKKIEEEIMYLYENYNSDFMQKQKKQSENSNESKN